VGGIDDARAHGQRTAAYGGRIEEFQSHAATDHIDYRVHGPDLVEGDLLGVFVVDGAFRDGQKTEGLDGAGGGSLRQFGALYGGADIPEGPVEVLLRVSDGCPERADTVYLDTLHSEVEAYAEAAQEGRDLGQRRSRRDERGEGHVAGRATDGLEMNVFQDRSPGFLEAGLR
jgi:hypothetical protein